MSTATHIKLLSIRTGHYAHIFSLKQLNPLFRQRLIELGVSEGTTICLKKKGWLGSPITIESNGQLIGIRQHEAQLVEVLPV